MTNHHSTYNSDADSKRNAITKPPVLRRVQEWLPKPEAPRPNIKAGRIVMVIWILAFVALTVLLF
jgi:hypothetical protein